MLFRSFCGSLHATFPRTEQAYIPPPQPTYPPPNQPHIEHQQPPPIHQTVLSDDALRTLVQATRENQGSRNRSIAIAKLITKFQGESDLITYVERFEQVCAAFGDVSDGDKIGAFGIQLDGKVGAWYRALKNKLKDTWVVVHFGVFS